MGVASKKAPLVVPAQAFGTLAEVFVPAEVEIQDPGAHFARHRTVPARPIPGLPPVQG